MTTLAEQAPDDQTIPDWLARELPSGGDWQRMGPNRYRGTWHAGSLRECMCYVLTDSVGTQFGRLVTDSWVPADRAFRKLEGKLARRILLECVVRDCGTQATVVFTVAAAGRLAGRDWHVDDEIRLCSRHGTDVYRAEGTYGVDHLADWLIPDAKPDPLDDHDAPALHKGIEIRQHLARMLLVRRDDDVASRSARSERA